MAPKIKEHKTAGCFLIRKNIQKKNWEICLIWRQWNNGKEAYLTPKGHIEKGETIEQTALRETQEETGYKNIKILKFLDKVHIEYIWDDGFFHKKDISWFLAILLDDNNEGQKLEINERQKTMDCQWYEIHKAYDLLTYEDDKKIMEKVIDIVEKGNL